MAIKVIPQLYQSVYPEVDVRLHVSFAAAVTAIGATPTTLIVSNDQAVAADITVPATLTLRFTNGGSLSIADTKTVTINGHVEAGLYQIFKWTGTGKVVVGAGSLKEVYLKWWGAVENGTTDDSVPFQAAVLAVLAINGTIKIPSGSTVRITTQITCTGVGLEGANRDSSKILVNYAGVGIYSAGTRGFFARNLTIAGTVTFDWANVPVAGSIGIHTYQLHNCVIDNVYFYTLGTGLKIEAGGYYGVTERCHFQRCSIGVHLLSHITDGPPNEQNIIYNQFNGLPASVGGPLGTAIRLEGLAAHYLDGIKIIGNGIENWAVGIYFARTNYCRYFWNRYETNTARYAFETSEAVDSLESMEIAGGGSYPAMNIGHLLLDTSTPEALKVGRSIITDYALSITDGTNEIVSFSDASILSLADNYLAMRFSAGPGLLIVSGSTETARWLKDGRLGIKVTPTANVHCAGSTTAAGTAALKINSGAPLTTPESGAFEYDGTNLYFTTEAGRKTVTLT